MSAQVLERSRRRLRGRLHEVTLWSPALCNEVALRVLLPPGHDSGSSRFPVLWLLHGGDDDHRCWSEAGRVEQVVGDAPIVVVMPSCGAGGWYSDWACTDGPAGPQRWERHHLEELPAWLAGALPVRDDRAGHAIAGLSMGGFGAMSYAARRPDRFGFAASFSGAVDICDPHLAPFADAMATLNGGRPGDIWGAAGRSIARVARNPVDLASNLAHTQIQLRSGNGRAPGGGAAAVDLIEATVHRTSSTLHQRLVELGIPHLWDDYGPGVHDWPHWVEALERTLPAILDATGRSSEAPASIDHVFGDDVERVWGWSVRTQGTRTSLSRLRGDVSHWRLEGEGVHVVRTPPVGLPGALVPACVDGRERVLTADHAGSLEVHVELGSGRTASCQLPRARRGQPGPERR